MQCSSKIFHSNKKFIIYASDIMKQIWNGWVIYRVSLRYVFNSHFSKKKTWHHDKPLLILEKLVIVNVWVCLLTWYFDRWSSFWTNEKNCAHKMDDWTLLNLSHSLWRIKLVVFHHLSEKYVHTHTRSLGGVPTAHIQYGINVIINGAHFTI